MNVPCNVDKSKVIRYNAHVNMKRLIFTVLVLIAIAAPVRVMAADQEIICPEPYGGGVVCGIHTPVNTGIGDNLAVVGGVLLVSSLVFLFLSKKFNKVSA
jgi:LPXTG-motif cell wall-anchored protein